MVLALSTACAALAAESKGVDDVPASAPQTAAAAAPNAALSAEEAAQKQLCDDIIAKADARREAILSSPTDVTVAGTSYYVSAEGDDLSDGLTEATAWRTAAKVNEADLQPGDGVFFRRGDVFRMDMIANNHEGVTYSAYGEGEKTRLLRLP